MNGVCRGTGTSHCWRGLSTAIRTGEYLEQHPHSPCELPSASHWDELSLKKKIILLPGITYSRIPDASLLLVSI